MPTLFRPCIDIHEGQVKQIVGGTLKGIETGKASFAGGLDLQQNKDLVTNFVSQKPASYYAELYRDHNLQGGHVIMLGTGQKNVESAGQALATWPRGLQVGGGINIDNCVDWLDRGAAKIIVTSWLFPDGSFSSERLRSLSEKVGSNNIVVDLSCRSSQGGWVVAMNKWQSLTDTKITESTLSSISGFCSEFLIHSANFEGLCEGVDKPLIRLLGNYVKIPCTYAGGARTIEDLKTVDDLSNGRVDLTIGSALDIFGGNTARFTECCDYNRLRQSDQHLVQ